MCMNVWGYGVCVHGGVGVCKYERVNISIFVCSDVWEGYVRFIFVVVLILQFCS